MGSAAFYLATEDAPFNATSMAWFLANSTKYVENLAGGQLDLTSLFNAVDCFTKAAQGNPNPPFSVSSRLMQQFLSTKGLPERPFFRNLLVAPGMNTGYTPIVFPGVTQALLDSNATLAKVQLSELVGKIAQACQFLSSSIQ